MNQRALVAATALAATLSLTGSPSAKTRAPASYDIVIYGGSSAAVTAAVQARKMGKTVVIVAPEKHIGGLTTGGLGATDIGNKRAIGGLARTVYEQVAAHYAQDASWRFQTLAEFNEHRHHHVNQPDPLEAQRGRPAMWVFEPHVAENILTRMLADAKVPVYFGQYLDRKRGVTKTRNQIKEIRTLQGNRYRGKIFIDATYEGDLMAAAGVSYHVGREANSVYGETINGVQATLTRHHNFKNPVDPYVVPGKPDSGLLPGIAATGPGKDGEGDARVQAYNFRMTLTDAPDNKRPIPRPSGYDPMRYELLRRYIATGIFDALNLNTAMPNRKTDINNHGGFSSDHIGANYNWPEADHDERKVMFEDHKNYLMGMWYFLQNDSRLPVDVREKANQWGLCKDEFQDTEHWPNALYVREGRRMISDYVMTEQDCRGQRVAPESVGMGAYNMDSHNVQRYVEGGKVRNEGDLQVRIPGPYPIAYRSILAREQQAANLLVPVALSSSHIAFGSIRMEPVFLVLGQSAATAAALALDKKTTLHKLPYPTLRARLLADGQVLETTAPSGVAQ